MPVTRSLRSVVVALGASALVVAAAGPASAQGSLQAPLVDLGSLAKAFGMSLPTTGPEGTPDQATETIATRAFAGRLTAAMNEARGATGAGRLVTSPALQAAAEKAASAMAGADKLGAGLPQPAGAREWATFARELPAGATPEDAVAAILADPSQRAMLGERAYDIVGVGVSAADDGSLYVVVGLARF